MSDKPTRAIIEGRRRMLVLGLALPAIAAAAATVVLHSWLPRLPAQVAVHWGTDAGPNGFAAAGSLWWLPLLVLIGPIALTVVEWTLGRDALTRRICLSLSWFLTVFLLGLTLSIAYAQLGLTDAHDVGDIDGLISACLLAAIAVAAGGWFLMPADPPFPTPARLDPSTAHLPLAPGERVVWTQVVRSRLLVPITVGVLGALCLTLGLLHAWDGLLTLALVGVVILVLEALFSAARVTIDSAGLRVAFGPGIKVRSIAARDVQDVTVIDVNPMRDYAGYGIRTGRHGTIGVIMRKGEAIQVALPDGRTFVVTVPGAESGAQALAAVALQAQRRAA